MTRIETLVLLAAALGAAAAACSPLEAPPAVAAEGASGVSAPVRYEPIRRAAVAETYEAVGTVRSRTSSVLSSRIVGAVTGVHVQEGDSVRAEQLLLELDDRDVQAQLQKTRAGLREAQDALDEVAQGTRAAEAGRDAATANRELAEATFRRYEALHGRGSVSDQEFDEVRARFKAAAAEERRASETVEALLSKRRQVLARIDQAKADVTNTETYVAYARITAPFAGIVTAKHANVGSLAAPGTPLVTLEDSAHYRFEAVVDESKVGQIRLGSAADVRVDALPDLLFAGTVGEIVPTADPASRSVIVKIDLAAGPTGAGRPGILRSGFFGRARFAVGEQQVLAVPLSALVRRGQLVGVYVVDAQQTARMRLIKTGKERDGLVEVLSGLESGENVVVDGAGAISDGTRITSAEGGPRP